MKSSGAKVKNKPPKLPKVSEEMKAWSTALAAEVGGWPQVASRSFFGFTAFYRRKHIFTLLPRSRAMQTPNSLAFKLESPRPKIRTQLKRDPRVTTTAMRKTRWFRFELGGPTDLRDALDWLGKAYEATGRAKSRA